ncbi:MAG: hypothetical protein IID39_09890, partial [Planctomycetes bacterium]|nr:hypothetical protein [Planctomycetota bacterium]
GQLESLMELHDGQVLMDDPVLTAARKRIEGALSNFQAAEEALWKLLNVR